MKTLSSGRALAHTSLVFCPLVPRRHDTLTGDPDLEPGGRGLLLDAGKQRLTTQPCTVMH